MKSTSKLPIKKQQIHATTRQMGVASVQEKQKVLMGITKEDSNLVSHRIKQVWIMQGREKEPAS